MHGQHQDVRQRRQNVHREHESCPQDQRKRDIALGILHLACGKRDVVPCVGGKQRPHLHHGQDHKHIHEHDGTADTHLHRMQRTPSGILPELAQARAEVGLPCRGVAPDSEGEQDQRRQAQRLGRCEDILDERAQLDAKDVHHRQEDDNDNAGEVGRADANLHVAQHHGPDLERGNVCNMP